MHDQCTLDDVCRALSFLDPECDRDTWARLAMSIKSEFGDSGFDAWDDWSKGHSKYRAADARSTWKSVRGAGGVGIGTLFALAKERGFTFERRELTAEEKRAWAKEKAERERQRKIDAEREVAERLQEQRQVAELAHLIIGDLKPVGSSEYLGQKKIQSHGMKFFHSPVLIVHREEGPVRVTDRSEISAFFNIPKDKQPKFHYFKKGFFALPLVDIDGNLWNLQVITPKGKKLFLRGGRKSGLFAWLGQPDPRMPLVLVEGFATGASVREATGCPVVVCFDCGNLMPVAVQLRGHYPEQHLVFAADDDAGTKDNPGVSKARAAAKAVGGAVWIPSEADALEDAA
ncbi:PriCT-2 domain-containing protein [Microbulbifer salipaludis]|uniref:PriCT-2 domain-containing protein n=1 Tax=Microbulbifer salipaludis TaxID=187980 RepID=A0ABS3E944_9GAMM|nr:PriCT-2 domain-containing protein [Microbulbifer salipaludis]MBN8431826.1 PriCT-2 domain-containing protein [Microbulbifer salipaludis]